MLLKKYEMLVKEWNAITIAIAIYFSSATIGLVFALIFNSMIAVLVMLLMMSLFGIFEFRIRRVYVDAKLEIERQLGIKSKKEIIKKGILW